MLQAQSSFPPGRKSCLLFLPLFELNTNSLLAWVESTNWPFPAVQLVPSSFIQDGLAPSLYSSAPIKCITCIILKKKCVSRGHGRSCKECNTKKHNCSTVSDPARFLQMVEDLRPMINLGPEGTFSFYFPFTTRLISFLSFVACFEACNRTPSGLRPTLHAAHPTPH